MKRREMIKSKKDFSEMINNKLIKKNHEFTIHYEKNNTFTHFGIAVPTKYGHAHERNRIKRQLRNIIDNNKNLFKNNYNYIIMIKRSCIDLTYDELEKSLTSLIKKEN